MSVIDLSEFRKTPTGKSEGTVFIVQDKTGTAHRIEAEKMGTSPTALCFFRGDVMVFVMPLELLYVATVEDGSIKSYHPSMEATPEPVEQDNTSDGSAA